MTRTQSVMLTLQKYFIARQFDVQSFLTAIIPTELEINFPDVARLLQPSSNQESRYTTLKLYLRDDEKSAYHSDMDRVLSIISSLKVDGTAAFNSLSQQPGKTFLAKIISSLQVASSAEDSPIQSLVWFSVVVALCGWSTYETERSDLMPGLTVFDSVRVTAVTDKLHCSLCGRSVDLNFFVFQDQAGTGQQGSSEASAQEIIPQIEQESRTQPQAFLTCPSNKLFDPLMQHRSFCPWVAVHPRVARPSSSTSYDATVTGVDSTDGRQPGWFICARDLDSANRKVGKSVCE